MCNNSYMTLEAFFFKLSLKKKLRFNFKVRRDPSNKIKLNK